MKLSRALLAGLMVALAVPVCAQSLAELAKKEQERRKAAAPGPKVYTDDDLKKITVPGGASPAPAQDPGAKPADASGKTGASDGKGGGAAEAADKGKEAAGEAERGGA